jgi:hypothetical protein
MPRSTSNRASSAPARLTISPPPASARGSASRRPTSLPSSRPAGSSAAGSGAPTPASSRSTSSAANSSPVYDQVSSAAGRARGNPVALGQHAHQLRVGVLRHHPHHLVAVPFPASSPWARSSRPRRFGLRTRRRVRSRPGSGAGKWTPSRASWSSGWRRRRWSGPGPPASLLVAIVSDLLGDGRPRPSGRRPSPAA